MTHYKSALLILFLSGIMGCAGYIPSEVKDRGATLLEECPENLDVSLSEGKGVILTSIVVHMMGRDTWYFLLKDMSTRSKYVLRLRPSIFTFQWASYKSQPRPYCYMVPPGSYQFVKAYTHAETGGPTVPTPTRVRPIEYDYRERFQVQAGKVSYIGQILIEDPRVKDKSFFGQWLAMLLAFPNLFVLENPYFPENLEFTRSDKFDDDITWLERNTKTQKTSVVNAVNF